MQIKPLHDDFIKPTKGSIYSAGFDIYMPESGIIDKNSTTVVPLGFASAIPYNMVALIFPRSGVGAREGLELNNTCGVIDSDYRGEWKAVLRLKDNTHTFAWSRGERLLQFILMPVSGIEYLEVVTNLPDTERNDGGFGSTGS